MVEIKNIIKLLEDRRDTELTQLNRTKENVDPGFNAFSLVSSIYYRENLHSDVLSAILDINGKHEGGDRYLMKFIYLINSHKRLIDPDNYTHATIDREKGRRDITITGRDGHVIIIENKINDAGDTHNQIPKYVSQITEQGGTADAVVYLVLNQSKEPNESTWVGDDEQKKQIRGLLVPIRAYDGTTGDLCNGWLKECIEVTTHIDSLSILRQYYKILRYLTRNHMDHQFYGEFQKYLEANPGSSYIAASLRKTLENYPEYTLHNILQHFKIEERFKPFEAIRVWSKDVYYLFNFNVAGYSFTADIAMNSLEKITIDMSVRGEIGWRREYPEVVLSVIGLKEKFDWDNNGRFVHTIAGEFSTFERKAIEFLTELLNSLRSKHVEIEAALTSLREKSVAQMN